MSERVLVEPVLVMHAIDEGVFHCPLCGGEMCLLTDEEYEYRHWTWPHWPGKLFAGKQTIMDCESWLACGPCNAWALVPEDLEIEWR